MATIPCRMTTQRTKKEKAREPRHPFCLGEVVGDGAETPGESLGGHNDTGECLEAQVAGEEDEGQAGPFASHAHPPDDEC